MNADLTADKKTLTRTSRNLSIHKNRSLMTNQSDHVYRYNLVDAISFTLCWLPNYIVDISQPFVSQESVYTLGATESTWNMSQISNSKNCNMNFIWTDWKWIFEKIIMSWATYTARILVVTYFTMSPFFYFFYFGILTKENETEILIYGDLNEFLMLATGFRFWYHRCSTWYKKMFISESEM